jgi:hypothetical protein
MYQAYQGSNSLFLPNLASRYYFWQPPVIGYHSLQINTGCHSNTDDDGTRVKCSSSYFPSIKHRWNGVALGLTKGMVIGRLPHAGGVAQTKSV